MALHRLMIFGLGLTNPLEASSFIGQASLINQKTHGN